MTLCVKRHFLKVIKLLIKFLVMAVSDIGFIIFFSGVVQNYLHIFHWRQVYFGLYPRIRRMSIEHVRWWRSSRVPHDIDVQTCYCRTPNISIRYDVIKPQTAISTSTYQQRHNIMTLIFPIIKLILASILLTCIPINWTINTDFSFSMSKSK